MLKKISLYIEKYLILIIMLLSATALRYPDAFKGMTNYTALFLAAAMFGMGTSIEVEDFKNLLKVPKLIFLGAICQYTIMPLLALFLSVIFKLPKDISLGVILVGACPGGTASNVLSHIAEGDLAYSVLLTVASTLLAPIMTPLLVYMMAGSLVEVSFMAMFMSIVKVIVLPVGLGIVSKALLRERIKKVDFVFPLISSMAIALIIAAIVGLNAEKIMTSGLLVFGVVIIHNILGLGFGLGLGKLMGLDYDKQSTLSIEVGTQNSGLAVVLANTNFAMNPLAALPGAIFSVVQNLIGSIFAHYRESQREKKLEEVELNI
ncbi:bile acid:sodium symporter family protein [Peptoniphilus vaginalis]|uniref:bile acid:sodium symporter family protein n=1 Tax=Peptoniphilus vaginalis TaxID=1756987 RepID=UPI001AD99DF6|nr:bile acid:sodium symporter family protein [Peptoniphilus vaginalis]